MHELAICQGLMSQVERLASEQGARCVDHIVLSLGPLSGVEPTLLERAFEIARFGTVADKATLEIQSGPLVVECRNCGLQNEAQLSRLLCKACESWQVNVIKGDEMLLMRVELSGIMEGDRAHGDPRQTETEMTNV